MDKNQVAYLFQIVRSITSEEEGVKEINKAFSILNAVQEHLLGITDLDGFVAKLEAIQKDVETECGTEHG